MPQQSNIKEFSTEIKTDNGFHEWNNYPLNLLGYDAAVEVDLGTYHARLCADVSRLLGTSTTVYTLAIEYSQGIEVLNDIIRAVEDLERYLSVYSESASTFFTVRPLFSFGKLQISEEILKKLLTYLKAFPGFLDLLHIFGEKIDQEDEDFGVYKQHITKEGTTDCTTFELCYNLKYVEQRPDIDNTDRLIWTTRKMGVYSKNCPQKNHSAWILLQPSAYFSQRLNEVFTGDEIRGDPKRRHDFEVHLLALHSTNKNWTPYINFLEKGFKKMDRKVFLWRPGGSLTLELEDIQKIHILRNKLLQLSHSLDINHGIISSLKEGLQAFQEEGQIVYASTAEFNRYDTSLKSYLFQTTQQKNRVDNLIRHVDGLFSLIPNILARRENSIMLKVSEKATQYARSMKVITILTMIYLPPSLMAGVFGMQIVTWEPGHSPKLAPEIGYYLLVTGILMTLTWVGYKLWERRTARRRYDDETLGKEEL